VDMLRNLLQLKASTGSGNHTERPKHIRHIAADCQFSARGAWTAANVLARWEHERTTARQWRS